MSTNKERIMIECLTVCMGENCNGITFTRNSFLLNEIFIPQHAMRMKTSKQIKKNQFEDIHGGRDSIIIQLNHIAESIAELKKQLLCQQIEHIKPIQNKLVNFTSILEALKTFHPEAHNETKIIGKNIRIKQSRENILSKVAISSKLTPSINSGKNSFSMLSQKLQVFVSNLKTQTTIKHRIIKRFIYDAEWIGHLYLNRLKLSWKSNDSQNLNLLSTDISARCSIGKIVLDKLFIQTMENPSYEIIDIEKKQYKRAISLTSLSHINIVAKSINNVDWGDFLNSIYRKGANIAVNGLFQFTMLFLILLFFSKILHIMYTYISGNIGLEVSELTLLRIDSIDGALTSDLITIPTDQEIETSFYVPEILTTDVNARVFNDIPQFANKVVLLASDSVIEGMIYILFLNSTRDSRKTFSNSSFIHLARIKIVICDVKEMMKLSDQEGDDMTEHVIGTLITDLSQIYNGRIIIQGSVNINNLFVITTTDSTILEEYTTSDEKSSRSMINVNNISFNLLLLHKEFWVKTMEQVQ